MRPSQSPPLIDNRFFYDETNNLIQTGQSHTPANSPLTHGDYQTEYYQYDAVGQLSKAIIKQQSTPFNYDEAGNWLPDEDTLVSHNRLTLTADYRNVYDGFGRLHRSTHRKTKQERLFSYNSEHQLTEVWFKHHPEFSRATYHYDALGRRTQKRLYRHKQNQPEIITFHWQGLKMSGEQSSLRPKSSTTYLYIENSYEPQARIDKTANNWNIYYYHTQLNGLPQELTDYGGHIVWKGRYSVWGKLQNETSELTQPQNLRFQGQYYDAETGLHYNTFRYYDPDSGHYTQQDPIGLAGGINQYAYAPNPLMWVDPLGLTPQLPDNAIVCRGGACLADSFKNGSGVIVDSAGKLDGVSVNSAVGKTLGQLTEGIPHNKVGVTTVGDIRAAGGDVISSPTRGNPNHATLSGITADQAQDLMAPTQKNPSTKPKSKNGGGC